MQGERLSELRRKERICTNLLLAAYSAMFLALLMTASDRVVYVVLGVALLALPAASWLTGHPHPPLLLFPGMKELAVYEREKLGKAWRKSLVSSTVLMAAFSLFFFVQAWIREGDSSFLAGIPVWYPLIVPVLLFLFGNLSLRSNSRRIDRMTTEQLETYYGDRALFFIVFTCVVAGMTILGAAVYLLLT
jgi:hypothetical protein